MGNKIETFKSGRKKIVARGLKTKKQHKPTAFEGNWLVLFYVLSRRWSPHYGNP